MDWSTIEFHEIFEDLREFYPSKEWYQKISKVEKYISQDNLKAQLNKEWEIMGLTKLEKSSHESNSQKPWIQTQNEKLIFEGFKDENSVASCAVAYDHADISEVQLKEKFKVKFVEKELAKENSLEITIEEMESMQKDSATDLQNTSHAKEFNDQQENEMQQIESNVYNCCTVSDDELNEADSTDQCVNSIYGLNDEKSDRKYKRKLSSVNYIKNEICKADESSINALEEVLKSFNSKPNFIDTSKALKASPCKIDFGELSSVNEMKLTKSLGEILVSKVMKSSVWKSDQKQIAYKVINDLYRQMKKQFPHHCKKLHIFPQGNTFQGLRAKHANEFTVHFRFGRPFCPHQMNNAKVNFVKYEEQSNASNEDKYWMPVVQYSLNRNKLVTLMPGIEMFVTDDNPSVVLAGTFSKGIFAAIKHTVEHLNETDAIKAKAQNSDEMEVKVKDTSERVVKSKVKSANVRKLKDKVKSINVSEQPSGAHMVIKLKNGKQLNLNIIISVDMSRSSDVMNLLCFPLSNWNYLKAKWTHGGNAIAYLVPYDDQLWWVDFNPFLKFLMNGRGCLRSILRLLMVLYTRHWKDHGLNQSYVLTVVILQYLFICKRKRMEQNDLGKHFFRVLWLLKICIQAKKLMDCFVPFRNLLEFLSDEESRYLVDSVEKIINSIEKNPSSVKTYF